jgi:hypothetical protein
VKEVPRKGKSKKKNRKKNVTHFQGPLFSKVSTEELDDDWCCI